MDILFDLEKRMTPTQYKAFYLRVIEEKSFSQIGDIIGLTPNGAFYAYHKAFYKAKRFMYNNRKFYNARQL